MVPVPQNGSQSVLPSLKPDRLTMHLASFHSSSCGYLNIFSGLFGSSIMSEYPTYLLVSVRIRYIVREGLERDTLAPQLFLSMGPTSLSKVTPSIFFEERLIVLQANASGLGTCNSISDISSNVPEIFPAILTKAALPAIFSNGTVDFVITSLDSDSCSVY